MRVPWLFSGVVDGKTVPSSRKFEAGVNSGHREGWITNDGLVEQTNDLIP